MSVRVPLTVRLSNSTIDYHVTPRLRDLTIRSAVPGGFASATFSLEEPLARSSLALVAFTDVEISDTRSGNVIWQGKLEDPTPGSADEGEVWFCTAMGPSARAGDQTLPLVYMDTDLTRFQKTSPSDAGAIAQVENDPSAATETEMIKCQFPGGETIANNSRAMATYDALAEANMSLGAFKVTRLGGKTDANYVAEVYVGDATTPLLSQEVTQSLTVAGGNSNRYVIDHFAAGGNRLSVRLRRSAGGATTVADDVTWVAWSALTVVGRRYNKSGVLLSGAAQISTTVLLASDVVEDLLGRCLTSFDGAGAIIATNSFNISQLAYTDGVTPEEVFEDLMALEPAYYWAAWEGTPSRFEWSLWPTVVSYECDVTDGYVAPSSVAELFNSVVVRWRNGRGRLKTSRYTATVSSLAAAGLSRQALIDLGDEVGSQTNADKAGANFLADHAYPANAGTVTIARPILNLDTGCVEQPWQIRPGRLVSVRGVQPSPDALNTTGANGVTVMRIVATEYSAASNEVVCELDSYSRALARSLARVDRQRRR